MRGASARAPRAGDRADGCLLLAGSGLLPLSGHHAPGREAPQCALLTGDPPAPSWSAVLTCAPGKLLRTTLLCAEWSVCVWLSFHPAFVCVIAQLDNVMLPDLTSCGNRWQVMIDHERKLLRLIDWGLAEFYHPNKEYAPYTISNSTTCSPASLLGPDVTHCCACPPSLSCFPVNVQVGTWMLAKSEISPQISPAV
jgi:hypothetical protein